MGEPTAPVSNYAPPANAGSRARRGGFPFLTLLIALGIIIVVFVALAAFGGAEVKVTPETQTTRVDGEFTATAYAGDLPYELVTVEKTATKSVPAESTVSANDPAQGTITIYNESEDPQEFVKNTRFETSSGLIFRVREGVRIPAGSPGKPGTAKVTVYAEAGGEKYNVGPTTFTLPGLASSPLYDQVYAKSEEAMSGGFTGERPAVGDATKTTVVNELRASLESGMEEDVKAGVREGYVYIQGSTFATFETLPDTSGDQGTVNVRVKAMGSAIILSAEALAKAAAHKTLAVYGGEPVTFMSVDGLSLKATEDAPPGENEPFVFSLTGEATIVWKVDTAKVAGAVAGKKRDSALTILSTFPEVGKAVLVLRPFWVGSYPEDPEKIKVSVVAP